MANSLYFSHIRKLKYMIPVCALLTIAGLSLVSFTCHFESGTSGSSSSNDNTTAYLKQFPDQSDGNLVKLVREKLLISPPNSSRHQGVQYNDTTNEDPTANLEKFELVKKLLGGRPGFFVECGASDGILLSSTLRLETTLNWTGLLIEPHPYAFQKLANNKRNAWIINVALCLTPFAGQVPFWIHPTEKFTVVSSLFRRFDQKFTKLIIPCIPLYTILLALNVVTVDYMNLDVEKSELGILSTLPFNRIRFNVLTIEHEHLAGGVQALRNFLEPRGYRFVKTINGSYTKDSLFIHQSIQFPTL